MVGAIGFESTASQYYEVLAGLGWQPKDRNGSQRNSYWTLIGHSFSRLFVVPFDKSIPTADPSKMAQEALSRGAQ
jgi:hypothetical protein